MTTVTEERRPQGAPRKRSERTCAGCRRTAAPDELVRLAVVDFPPFVAPDLPGKLGGRGIWVEPRRSCVEAAVRRGGLSRGARRKVVVDVEVLLDQLIDQHRSRMEGLLASAVRRRAVAHGTDAVREAMSRGEIELLVVATDAAGRRSELMALAARLGRRCIVFGTKESLGRHFGKSEIGVLSILDAGIAAELVHAASRMAALSEAE